MGKKIICLSTREELRVFMSPQRQELRRIMALEGRPMTAKEIGDRMKLSASSAQLHLRKLAGLGLVEKDHTERINGITATYFRLADVDVNIGLDRSEDGLFPERDAVAQNLLMQIYKNCRDTLRRVPRIPGAEPPSPEELFQKFGDLRTGVLYLRPEEAEELSNFLLSFLAKHEKPEEGLVPWEFAFLIYNTRAGEEAGDA